MSDRTRSEDSQAQIQERLVDAEVRMEKRKTTKTGMMRT